MVQPFRLLLTRPLASLYYTIHGACSIVTHSYTACTVIHRSILIQPTTILTTPAKKRSRLLTYVDLVSAPNPTVLSFLSTTPIKRFHNKWTSGKCCSIKYNKETHRPLRDGSTSRQQCLVRWCSRFLSLSRGTPVAATVHHLANVEVHV